MKIPSIVTELHVKVGDKVVRGRDWKWGSQDQGSKYGVVVKLETNPTNWVYVQWMHAVTGEVINANNYQVGADDCYDLYFYDQADEQNVINTEPLPSVTEQWSAILIKATETREYKTAPAGQKFKAMVSYLAKSYDIPKHKLNGP